MDGMDKKFWAMGHSKIFLKDTAIKLLQEKQRDLWKVHAITLQKGVRAHVARGMFLIITKKEVFYVMEKINIYCHKFSFLIFLEKYARLVRERKALMCLQTFIRQRAAKNLFESLITEFREKIRRITVLQSYIRRKNSIDEFVLLQTRNNAAIVFQKHARARASHDVYEVEKLRWKKSIVLVSYCRRIQV